MHGAARAVRCAHTTVRQVSWPLARRSRATIAHVLPLGGVTFRRRAGVVAALRSGSVAGPVGPHVHRDAEHRPRSARRFWPAPSPSAPAAAPSRAKSFHASGAVATPLGPIPERSPRCPRHLGGDGACPLTTARLFAQAAISARPRVGPVCLAGGHRQTPTSRSAAQRPPYAPRPSWRVYTISIPAWSSAREREHLISGELKIRAPHLPRRARSAAANLGPLSRQGPAPSDHRQPRPYPQAMFCTRRTGLSWQRFRPRVHHGRRARLSVPTRHRPAHESRSGLPSACPPSPPAQFASHRRRPVLHGARGRRQAMAGASQPSRREASVIGVTGWTPPVFCLGGPSPPQGDWEKAAPLGRRQGLPWATAPQCTSPRVTAELAGARTIPASFRSTRWLG